MAQSCEAELEENFEGIQWIQKRTIANVMRFASTASDHVYQKELYELRTNFMKFFWCYAKYFMN